LESTKVPKAVNESFIVQYPAVTNIGWYGYPNYDFYNDWYGYDPTIYEYENPQFYIVEFMEENQKHKVIYSKDGKKIATHKIFTSVLPQAVTDAINKGSYSSWSITKEKEEIFRDSKLDKIRVYKVVVEKGSQKHNLFYSIEGELLKDKIIN
jgi:hypothetical protein